MCTTPAKTAGVERPAQVLADCIASLRAAVYTPPTSRPRRRDARAPTPRHKQRHPARDLGPLVDKLIDAESEAEQVLARHFPTALDRLHARAEPPAIDPTAGPAIAKAGPA